MHSYDERSKHDKRSKLQILAETVSLEIEDPDWNPKLFARCSGEDNPHGKSSPNKRRTYIIFIEHKIRS